MKIEYSLTPRLRIFLKEPFGTLIEGSPRETMSALKQLIEKEAPTRLVSVGDVVSKSLHEFAIHPQLTIIDFFSLRNQAMPKLPPADKIVCADNPQGTITVEAINAIREALDSNSHTHLEIQGEEDLLTLIAVLYAPENSFVIYGQPHLGIVVVKASQEKKEQVKQLLKEMKV